MFSKARGAAVVVQALTAHNDLGDTLTPDLTSTQIRLAQEPTKNPSVYSLFFTILLFIIYYLLFTYFGIGLVQTPQGLAAKPIQTQ